jgi:hypothetical protein
MHHALARRARSFPALAAAKAPRLPLSFHPATETDDLEHDLPCAADRRNLHSTNSVKRLNGEIKRRADGRRHPPE